MFGSVFIIQSVLRNNHRSKRVYHRLLLLMSSMDLIFSIKEFMSTWIIPKETGVWGAKGTTATCTATGFFGQGSGLTSILYNGMLTLFFLLTIRFGWTETRVQRIEPILHAVPLAIGWATAIAGLPLDLYNPIGINCWIGGEDAWVYRWAFFHGPLWAVFGFSVIAMIMMYLSVKKQERAVAAYRMPADPSRRLASSHFAAQACFYIAVFFLTWIFPMVQWVLIEKTGKVYTPILFLQTIFVPLAGFFNFLVYLRPRYRKFRQDHPEISFVFAMSRSFNSIRRREPFCRPSEAAMAEQKSDFVTQERDRYNDTASVESGSPRATDSKLALSSELEAALEEKWDEYLD